MIRTVLVCVSLLALTSVSQFARTSEPHLSKDTAMQIGLAALKSKYPSEYSYFVSKYEFLVDFRNGIWYVYGSLGKQVLGGGGPVIEIRDRDEKILKIYFAR